jgi:hypothetical protein
MGVGSSSLDVAGGPRGGVRERVLRDGVRGRSFGGVHKILGKVLWIRGLLADLVLWLLVRVWSCGDVRVWSNGGGSLSIGSAALTSSVDQLGGGGAR